MNSKEALEVLLGYASFNERYYFHKGQDPYGIILKDLERLEKLEKVIAIIKEEFNVEIDDDFWINLEINSGYGIGACFKDRKDIYKLLKEVLGNE